MMSRLLILIANILLANLANAQGIAASANGTSMVAKLEDLSSNLYYDVNANATKGSPFLFDKTGTGTLWVQKKEEIKYTGFECRFDVMTNKMQVLFAGNWYAINDRINQASLSYVQGRDTVKMLLRSHYPSIAGANDSTTIYEVVEDGKSYQMLRYYRKTKTDISMQGSAYQYEYRLSESWYLYNATLHKIASIEKNPISSGIIPPDQLEAYKAGHKLPRKLGDWKKMVQWLNATAPKS